MRRVPLMRPAVYVADTRTAKPPPKQRAAHYATAGHGEWRAEVIRRARGVCQGPRCGRSGVRLFADHVVELRDGGAPFDPQNGQALCGACHSRKTAAARAARQGEGGDKSRQG
jgi:5-methylcytosine-specific restriction enzyme A